MPVDFKTMLRPVTFGKTAKGDTVPTPIIIKPPTNRRVAALKEASEILAHLPGPGESLHAIMTGRYDLTDLIDVLLAKLGPVEHLRIATLSFNKHNAQLLTSWLDPSDGNPARVGRLSILASLFFREHNPDLFESLRQDLAERSKGKDPDAGHKLASARSHCKVVCFHFQDKQKIALEGSANLRTNSNREQFSLICDPILHDWHAQWIDEQVATP